MKFAEKFLNMMKLNDADDETEPFDEEYNEVTEEEGYDEEEMEDEEEEPHKPILSLRRKKKDLTESQEDDEDSQSRVIPFHGKEEEGESVKVIRPQTFNEAQIVADFLKEGKTIVVNLEGIEIGSVSKISTDSSNLTKSAKVTPFVDFQHIEDVLVITQLKEVPADSDSAD